MDATSSRLTDQRQRKTGRRNGQSGRSTPPILTHEVKSGANRLGDGENAVLGRKLARAEAHVAEARAFVPYVAQRDPKRAGKLEECGSWLLFNEYIKTGDVRLASGIFCQQPLLCGFCAAGRAARQVQSITERIQHVRAVHVHLRPYMVTLTLKGRDQLKPMVTDAWKAWGRMIQRRRDSLRGRNDSVLGLMAGGFVAGEAKRGKGGQWHYHLHGVFLADLGRYAPIRERITREWSSVIGQSWASTQFEPAAGEVSDAAREAVKYASKWEPGEFGDRWTAFEALSRVRRVRPFGLLYGVKLPEEVTDDLTDMEAEEYIERAFRYGAGSYYEVQHAKREDAFDEFNQED